VESGGKSLVLYLAAIGTREAAEQATGRYLEAATRELPEGTYYWDQLVGLQVMDPDGKHLGELAEVFRAGGNEVYRIVGPSGERLVPALRSVVLSVDLEAGRMTVAPDDAEEVR
jgi:16S rRNA processing protein RimM